MRRMPGSRRRVQVEVRNICCVEKWSSTRQMLTPELSPEPLPASSRGPRHAQSGKGVSAAFLCATPIVIA